MEALNTAQHKIAEAMYRAAQTTGAGTTSGGDGAQQSSGSGTGDVIDAEVVEEEKK